MYVEIEVKLKVNSLAEVEQKLAELGAEFLAEQLQTDYLFDDANAALITTDRCTERTTPVSIPSDALQEQNALPTGAYLSVRQHRDEKI